MNNKRLLTIVISVFLFFLLIAGRLFHIQIIRSDDLKYYAQRQQNNVEKVKADRGCIYDRDGNMLVYNKNDISFSVEIKMLKEKDKKKLTKKFAEVFNKSESYYLNLLNTNAKKVCLEKKAPREKALLLKEFKVEGLYSEEDRTRVYEYGSLASHLLGYVGGDYTGQDGIEKTFEKYLCGEDGSRLIHKNAIGEMITVEEEETKQAHPGNNVLLTIDKSYQIILEEELKNGLTQFGGTSATGILMDPYTGEVLALSNKDDFNPNFYWKSNDTTRRNKAVTDLYEPGSTFKCISIAALLDMNLCRPDEQVFTENGAFKFKNVTIRDAHKGGWTTVKGVIEQSSNIGMAKLIQRIKNVDFYKYTRGFGFGNVTSVKLPAENKGSLKNPAVWNDVIKATLSYGYAVMVTPLQMVTAYAALINGGNLFEPQLIKKMTRKDGSTVYENQPKLVRRVITNKTSDIIRDFLVGAVEHGTGATAKVEGLRIGGKTGTSQQYIAGNYSKQHYNTSFVGYFPADNPKVVGIILVSAPVNGKFGGTVAAPIFKNVAKRIYNQEGKSFQNKPNENQNTSPDSKIQVSYASNVTRTENKSAENIFNDKNIYAKHIMPNLSKISGRDAILVLTRLGIQYKVKGAGKVISQSIAPGEKISGRSFCEVNCEEIKVSGAVIY